jgi:alpha-aminoadipate carrier protein LysW
MAKKCECSACFFEFEPESKVIVGEVISCPDCGADLEIIEITNDVVKVQVAEMSEEDWGE